MHWNPTGGKYGKLYFHFNASYLEASEGEVRVINALSLAFCPVSAALKSPPAH